MKTNEIYKKGIEEFIEKGADLEHSRWADWQKYMHSKMRPEMNGNENTDNGFDYVLPQGLYDRWERQIATDYKDLSEKEKDSDREQVRPYEPLIKTLTLDILKGEIERLEEEKQDLNKHNTDIAHHTNWCLQDQIDYYQEQIKLIDE